MIFDRTQNDIDAALRIRNEKVQKFKTLTSEEIEVLERGTMTINTINRIEQKQEELKVLFNDMGYWNTEIENKTDWLLTDIFDLENFQRIIDNLNILRQAFFVHISTPPTPIVSYHYQSINSLEKILYDLETMTQDVKSLYKICGTFNCGEE